MLNNLIKLSVIASALITTTATHSSTLTFDFTPTTLGDGLATFSFDDASLTGPEYEGDLYKTQLQYFTAFSATIDGTTFNLNDLSYYSELDVYFNLTEDSLAFAGLGDYLGSYNGDFSAEVFLRPEEIGYDYTEGGSNAVSGSWNTVSYVSAVPIPTAAWLFGSGLLGLVGVAKRKKV